MAADLVAGDTDSVLRVTCKDKELGTVIDLTNRTVKLKYSIANGQIQTRDMVIEAPATAGVARYKFANGELTPGKLQFEVEIFEANLDRITQTKIEQVSVRNKL